MKKDVWNESHALLLSHASPCFVFKNPLPPPHCLTASHSSSHPRNITWHASQGRSMIPALFIPSVLAIRLLPFPISPLRPMSVTYIRSFHFQRHDRAIKWTASDRRSGTSPLAVSPLRQWGRQLNQSCYLGLTKPIGKQRGPINRGAFFRGADSSGSFLDALWSGTRRLCSRGTEPVDFLGLWLLPCTAAGFNLWNLAHPSRQPWTESVFLP